MENDIDALRELLKNTFLLYMVSQEYHWNYQGSNFIGIHDLLEEMYVDLREAIDDFGEQLRYYGESPKLTQYSTNPAPSDNRVKSLSFLNKGTIDKLEKAFEVCEDEGTKDLLAERIRVHQNFQYKLNSVLNRN